MNIPTNKSRFYIYILALLPFILLCITGIILIKYHNGATPDTTVWGLDAHAWFPIHKITSLVTVLMILLHLFVKTNWVRRFFTFQVKGAFKTSNIILFIVFILCSITALLAWFVFGDTNVAMALGGIHNKLGLILIIVFLIHLWNYRKVILSQFKKRK